VSAPLSYALVTPSYWKDVDRCALLVESVERFVVPGIRHYLVIDRRDVPLFRPLLNARSELLVVEDLIPRWLFRVSGIRRCWISLRTRPVKNWVLQQIVKLSVPAAIRDDVLLCADSDMFFVRPYDPRKFERDGMLPLTAEPGQRGLIPNNDRWQVIAAKLLGIPPQQDFDINYIGNLVCWRRTNALAMLQRIEALSGRQWQRSIAGVNSVAEYILYGVSVDRLMGADSGHWHDPVIRNLNYWQTTPLDTVGLQALRARLALHHHSAMVSAKSRTSVADIRKVFFPDCLCSMYRRLVMGPECLSARRIEARPDGRLLQAIIRTRSPSAWRRRTAVKVKNESYRLQLGTSTFCPLPTVLSSVRIRTKSLCSFASLLVCKFCGLELDYCLMRQHLLCFIVLLFVGCVSSPSTAAENMDGASEGSADKPSTDTTWDQGLKSGANGPIPVIVVDQFGYPTKASKVAVIRDPQTGYDSAVHFTPGTHYAVIDQSTGTIVKSGTPTAWNRGATDNVSGDKVWWFDFSDVTTPGRYTVVDVDQGFRSVEFDIDDHVYRSVLKHAMRMYLYQRAGFEKTAATAGSAWADGPSHMGPGQDPQSHSWLAKTDASQVRDLRGGWFDAGDDNKYTSWTARNVIILLRAYDENPSAFGDDSGIAESGNGVPDVLDEAKWALDWLKRTQNVDGSLLCVQSLAEASPPSSATGPSYYGPPTTAATLMGAAVFAYAAKIYSARSEADLRAYANDLATRAKKAWDWATANPSVLYYNNDNAKQPGSGGLAAGQQEMDDSQRFFAKFEAAVYLYEQTGDASYKSFVESNYASILANCGPTQWDTDRQDALLYYTRLPRITDGIRSTILTKFITNVTRRPDQLPMVTGNKDPYRAPIKDYVWGSNQSKAAQARLYQLLALYGSDPAIVKTANSAALEYLHYIHGVNPLGLVYLTNMKRAGAENSANTLYHSWFAHGSARWDKGTDATPGPPPGYLVGGPNPGFALDPCCTAAPGTSAYQCFGAAAFSLCSHSYAPPLGQPAMKSYRQFNEGWPADSWEVSEPSTGYQASYIRVLAAYAR
jgi:endoglucanase